MKRVAITTLGCKTNQFESAAMTEQLEQAGYMSVSFDELAEIYIINSCTVTARTDAETRRLIRRAHRMNPEARIVATGCYAQVAAGDLEKMPELDSVLGNLEKLDIAALLESSDNQVSDISAELGAGALKLSSFAEHTRAFLQVQNGCNSFCAYCIVPYARGRSRSVLPGDVLEGVRTFAANGYKEVVLTGIHLGGYGHDLTPQTSLKELIKRIHHDRRITRVRIGSVEPNELDYELLGLMAESDIICPHLHLPLQSGSDSVLERMGRHYTADYLHKLIERISEAMPYAFIGADVIAGFPGETDQEFNDTAKLLGELPLSDLHVFPYSSRPGTRAALMSGHLKPDIVKERAARLRDIATHGKDDFLQRMKGRKLKVLVQGFNPATGLCNGLSRNYVSVSFAGAKSYINQEMDVTVLDCYRDGCTGVLSAD